MLQKDAGLTLKLGVEVESIHRLKSASAGSVAQIGPREFVAITQQKLVRFETSVVSGYLPFQLTAIVSIQEFNIIVGITAVSAEFVIILLEDTKNPIFTGVKTDDASIFNVFYCSKSKKLITAGEDVKVWTFIFKKGKNIVIEPPTINLSYHCTVAQNYHSGIMNPPLVDYEKEVLYLDNKNSTLDMYNLDGDFIGCALKYRCTSKTIAAFNIQSKKFLTSNSEQGLIYWHHTGSVMNRFSIGSTALCILFANKEFAIILESNNIISLLDVKTSRSFTCYRAPEKVFRIFLFKDPVFRLILCCHSSIIILRIILPWKLWMKTVSTPLSMLRCSKYNEAARLLVMCSDSHVKLISPSRHMTLTAITLQALSSPVSFFYDRGTKQIPRDQVILSLKDGTIQIFSTGENPCKLISSFEAKCLCICQCIFRKNLTFVFGTTVGNLLFFDYNDLKPVHRIVLYPYPIIQIYCIDKRDKKIATGESSPEQSSDFLVIAYEDRVFSYSLNEEKICDCVEIKGSEISINFNGVIIFGYDNGEIGSVVINNDRVLVEHFTNGLKIHDEKVTGLSLTLNSNYLVSTSSDMTVRVWNQEFILMAKLIFPIPLTSVAVLNGKRDIVVGTETEIMFIDGKTVFNGEIDEEDFEYDNYDLLNDALIAQFLALSMKEDEEDEVSILSGRKNDDEQKMKNKYRNLKAKRFAEALRRHQEMLTNQQNQENEQTDEIENGKNKSKEELEMEREKAFYMMSNLMNKGNFQNKSFNQQPPAKNEQKEETSSQKDQEPQKDPDKNSVEETKPHKKLKKKEKKKSKKEVHPLNNEEKSNPPEKNESSKKNHIFSIPIEPPEIKINPINKKSTNELQNKEINQKAPKPVKNKQPKVKLYSKDDVFITESDLKSDLNDTDNSLNEKNKPETKKTEKLKKINDSMKENTPKNKAKLKTKKDDNVNNIKSKSSIEESKMNQDSKISKRLKDITSTKENKKTDHKKDVKSTEIQEPQTKNDHIDNLKSKGSNIDDKSKNDVKTKTESKLKHTDKNKEKDTSKDSKGLISAQAINKAINDDKETQNPKKKENLQKDALNQIKKDNHNSSENKSKHLKPKTINCQPSKKENFETINTIQKEKIKYVNDRLLSYKNRKSISNLSHIQKNSINQKPVIKIIRRLPTPPLQYRNSFNFQKYGSLFERSLKPKNRPKTPNKENGLIISCTTAPTNIVFDKNVVEFIMMSHDERYDALRSILNPIFHSHSIYHGLQIVLPPANYYFPRINFCDSLKTNDQNTSKPILETSISADNKKEKLFHKVLEPRSKGDPNVRFRDINHENPRDFHALKMPHNKTNDFNITEVQLRNKDKELFVKCINKSNNFSKSFDLKEMQLITKSNEVKGDDSKLHKSINKNEIKPDEKFSDKFSAYQPTENKLVENTNVNSNDNQISPLHLDQLMKFNLPNPQNHFPNEEKLEIREPNSTYKQPNLLKSDQKVKYAYQPLNKLSQNAPNSARIPDPYQFMPHRIFKPVKLSSPQKHNQLSLTSSPRRYATVLETARMHSSYNTSPLFIIGRKYFIRNNSPQHIVGRYRKIPDLQPAHK